MSQSQLSHSKRPKNGRPSSDGTHRGATKGQRSHKPSSHGPAHKPHAHEHATAAQGLLLENSQKRLATLWFIGALVPILILLKQTFTRDAVYYTLLDGDRRVGQAQDAWAWLLSALMPTLSLVMGSIGAQVLRKHVPHQRVDPFAFRLVCVLSVCYLLLISAVLLMGPQASSLSPLGALQRSNLFISPLQGLLSAAMGWLFFVKPK